METKNTFNPTKEQLSKLTKTELSYWKIISCNSGVLNLLGKPGVGKTQTLRSLAFKLDLNVLDLRLTTMDETELGLFPKVVTVDGQDFVKFLPPYWVLDALKFPTLIILEEFNRANKYVTNAVMKLLSEREIGNIKLPNTVFLCTTGNLGDEDNCDVEILDDAKKNRLVTKIYDVNFKIWKEDFAKDNIHPLILNFLESNITYFYPENQVDDHILINNRSWTNLSEFIIKNHGINSIFSDFKDDLIESGSSYVGYANAKLISYLSDKENLKLIDILENDEKLEMFINLAREVKYSYLEELSNYDLNQFKEQQIERVVKMLNSVDKDVLIGVLTNIVKKTPKEVLTNSVIRTIINKHFSEIKDLIIKKTKEV
jgi:hypothetical protein